MAEESRGEPQDVNGPFERRILRDLGLSEDYVPRDENEAYKLVTAWLEYNK